MQLLLIQEGWGPRCCRVAAVQVWEGVCSGNRDGMQWGRGGAGCSGNGWLCQGRGDLVGVAASPRLGTMGLVSCVGDGAMWWQIRLHAASDVVVSERGWPSCTRGKEMAVML